MPETRGRAALRDAEAAKQVVRDCVERGVPRVWLRHGIGAVSEEAIRLCRDADITVIDGVCPLMFARPIGFGHRVHCWFARRRLAA